MQGWSKTDIAKELGISIRTVYSDVKFLQKQWRSKREDLPDEFESKYRYIYREAIAAWLRSLEDKQVNTFENVQGSEGDVARIKAQGRTEGQSGNPALLAQARGALQDIEDLLGLEQKSEAGSTEDNPLYHKFILLPPKDE